jgi:methionyl-tRNA formyltransferase
MLVQILIDNKSSWIVPYAKKMVDDLNNLNHNTSLIHNHDEVSKGDVLFLLSCEKKFQKLDLNKYNLVIHESDLPHGKGWSPLTWQVIEGKNCIPVTLFEASSDIDSGDIYLQKNIYLEGHELINELREKQADVTKELILEFIQNIKTIKSKKQVGDESFYPKRSAMDSKINIDESILSQFNILRTVDNERYPAFFELNGIKYKLLISKLEE